MDADESGRLRAVPCPKRLSNGPVIEMLKDYTLVEEDDMVKETEVSSYPSVHMPVHFCYLH